MELNKRVRVADMLSDRQYVILKEDAIFILHVDNMALIKSSYGWRSILITSWQHNADIDVIKTPNFDSVTCTDKRTNGYTLMVD